MKDAKGHGSDARGSYQNVSTQPLVSNATRDRLAAAAHQGGVEGVGKAEPPTDVLYKKDSDGGVFAAFPSHPGDMNPGTMSSYAHVGQHSAASQDYVRSAKPASPAEYADLHKELQSIGYNPRPIRRMTQAHFKARSAALKG